MAHGGKIAPQVRKDEAGVTRHSTRDKFHFKRRRMHALKQINRAMFQVNTEVGVLVLLGVLLHLLNHRRPFSFL
jgi:hypothetical protein